MTTRYTKALRQEIVREFATRHNGQFNPLAFLEEVRRTGPTHQAYDWFQWNRDQAAFEHNLEQARSFARDLRITFSVEIVGRQGAVRVKQSAVPMVISPVNQRRSGGGYFLVNTDDPSHMAEHCRQAGAALRAWLNRYEAALTYSDVESKTILGLARKLEQTSPPTA